MDNRLKKIHAILTRQYRLRSDPQITFENKHNDLIKIIIKQKLIRETRLKTSPLSTKDCCN